MGTALTPPPPPSPLMPSGADGAVPAPRSARVGAVRAAVRRRVSTEARKPRRRRVPGGDRAVLLGAAPLHQPGHAAAVRPFAHSQPCVCTPARPAARRRASPSSRLPFAPLHAPFAHPQAPLCMLLLSRLHTHDRPLHNHIPPFAHMLPFAHPYSPPCPCAATDTLTNSHLHNHTFPLACSRASPCTPTSSHVHTRMLTIACLCAPIYPPMSSHLHTYTLPLACLCALICTSTNSPLCTCTLPFAHPHTPVSMSMSSCLQPPALPFAHPHAPICTPMCSPLHVPAGMGSAAALRLQCQCSPSVPAVMRCGEHHPDPPRPPHPPGCVPPRNPRCPHRSDIDDDSTW